MAAITLRKCMWAANKTIEGKSDGYLKTEFTSSGELFRKRHLLRYVLNRGETTVLCVRSQSNLVRERQRLT